MNKKLIFYLRNFMTLINFLFYLYKAFFVCVTFTTSKKCNTDKMLDVIITCTLLELDKLWGYWSKNLNVLGSSKQTLRKIVPYIIEVRILIFVFRFSTHSFATFARLSLSINTLWISKIKTWFNVFGWH